MQVRELKAALVDVDDDLFIRMHVTLDSEGSVDGFVSDIRIEQFNGSPVLALTDEEFDEDAIEEFDGPPLTLVRK